MVFLADIGPGILSKLPLLYDLADVGPEILNELPLLLGHSL